MTARHEGRASAALVAHWLERRPAGFVVFRVRGDTPVGFAAELPLHESSAEELAADPGARAMWDWTRREAPPLPGEEVCGWRFAIDADAYQAMPSPTLNALTVHSTQRWLERRRPAWELLAGWADPDALAPMMAYIGFDRAPGADFEVDGRRYGVYAHDWRRQDADGWLEMMGTREAAPGFEPAPDEAEVPAVLALSRVEFGQAVKQALRDLQRPDALARNPLAGTRLVAEHAEPPDEVLEALVRQAVAALGGHPRDEKLQHVLDRTYLRPAPTQERAAELLGLPLSTYRRRLAHGVERVADLLWQRELSAN